MTFTPIDREHWARKEYFDHYFSQVPCTYSAVFHLDVTRLRQQRKNLYPTMLYHIAGEVNCREEFRRSRGPGRIPTMRYIEKAAYSWEREGIFSLEAAEGYIKRQGERKETRNAMAQAMGISSRPLSPSERRYLDGWAEMGFGPDAIAIAYDRTVLKTGGLAWRYMDSIIRSWHSKGLHTAQEIEAGDGLRRKTRAAEKPAAGGASPTQAELEEIKEALRRMKGES